MKIVIVTILILLTSGTVNAFVEKHPDCLTLSEAQRQEIVNGPEEELKRIHSYCEGQYIAIHRLWENESDQALRQSYFKRMMGIYRNVEVLGKAVRQIK